MTSRDGPNHGQAKSDTASLPAARSLQPVKRFEDAIQFALRHAGTIVVDLDHRHVAGAEDPGPGASSVLDGIVDQIVDQSLQGDGIAIDDHAVSPLYGDVGACQGYFVHHGLNQGRQFELASIAGRRRVTYET